MLGLTGGKGQSWRSKGYCNFAYPVFALLKDIDSTPPLNNLKNDYDYAWQEERNAAIQIFSPPISIPSSISSVAL